MFFCMSNDFCNGGKAVVTIGECLQWFIREIAKVLVIRTDIGRDAYNQVENLGRGNRLPPGTFAKFHVEI